MLRRTAWLNAFVATPYSACGQVGVEHHLGPAHHENPTGKVLLGQQLKFNGRKLFRRSGIDVALSLMRRVSHENR